MCVEVYRVRLHQDGGLVGEPLLLLDVVAHVAQFLLHHAHRLKVGRVVEGIASQQEQLTHTHTHTEISFLMT